MKINIKKSDEDLQIVYGEVYIPNVPDSDLQFMDEDTIRVMAYRFMANKYLYQIDTNHDLVNNTSYVVESFIARANDPLFIEGSWVVAVYVPDEVLWLAIKNKELNGFSVYGTSELVLTPVEIEIPQELSGLTDSTDDHQHTFTIRYTDEGKFAGGTTDIINNHRHVIKRGTITELAIDNNGNEHKHRYSLTEVLADAIKNDQSPT